MRTPLRLIFALCALLSFQALHAETSDPSDLFLKAYMTAQDADKLTQDNQLKEALTKYRFAASLLDQIRNRFPQWQPLIVDYRRKRTSESITQIQNQLSLSNSQEENTAPVPAIPGSNTATPTTTPSTVENPTPGQAAATPVISENPAATSSTATDTVATATREIRKSIEDLQRKYQEEHARLLVAQQQRDALAEQLDTARISKSENQSKLAQLQAQLAAANANATSVAANKEDRAKLQKLIRDLQSERDAADEHASELQSKLTAIRKTAQGAITDRDQAQAAVKKFPAQYAETQKKLAAVTKQRDDLQTKLTDSQKQFTKVAQERDTALSNLEKAKESGKQVDKLVAANTALTTKLADAEKTIKTLSASAPEKDAEIASLKKEIGGVKQQLTVAQQERNDSRSALIALQSQLDETTSHLEAAQNEPSASHNDAETQKLTQENQLLRGIVMRELREQAKREQTKQLVISQLSKLQGKSTDLINEIDYLGQPTAQLTDEEKKLFKLPVAEILQSGSGSVAAATPQTTGSAAAPVTSSTTGSSTVANAQPSPQASPQSSPLVTSSTTPSNTETGGEKTSGGEVGIDSLPDSLQTIAQKAQEQFKRNDYRDAEKSYEKILAVAPKNLYALSNLGVTRLRAGKLKSAEETFKRAILISPNNSFTHCSLGIVYFGEQRYDDAIKELTRALAIDPKNATAHNYLGITASTKGWQEAAEKELETAIALNSNYADAYFNLSVVQITKHPPETELAKYNYERARALGAAPDREMEKLLKIKNKDRH